MLNIKEIALEAGHSTVPAYWLSDEKPIACSTSNFEKLVSFAEAIVVELAKQNKPNNVKYRCYEKVNGELQWFREGTLKGFKHIPELDREITLPKGE